MPRTSVARKTVEAALPAPPDVLQALLIALERPFIRPDARARLQRLMRWYGEPHVTLLIRTITESEGNQDALVEPVISAVSDVMAMRPTWPEKGLAWIEAFDALPLTAMLQTMRELQIFREKSLGRYLGFSLHNKLLKVFEPPAPEKPQRKRGPQNRNTPRYQKLKAAGC